MKIFFEDRRGTKIEKADTSTHEAIRWYYDGDGDFHLVLRKKGATE